MSRAWVIGSGSSLKETPLHLLENEKTYAMNRIHLLYDETTWRPSHFFMVDFNQQNPEGYWHECIKAHWDTPKTLWRGFRDGHYDFPALGEGIGEVPNTTWIDRCKRHHYYQGDNIPRRAQSWHLPELCTAFSGLSTMLQIAVLDGADEIYLLGCGNYVPDYFKNHFIPRYTDDERDRSEEDNTNMNWLHKVAKISSPAKIYNATIGGHLEVHERVDMLEVLGAD